jgi:cation transport ATPase
MAKKFYMGVLVIALVFATLSWSALTLFQLDKGYLNAFIMSGILATINIVVVFEIIKFSQKVNNAEFNKRFLVSMGVRFAFLLGTIFITIHMVHIHLIAFLGSLFGLYFIYQIWEVYYLNFEFSKRENRV